MSQPEGWAWPGLAKKAHYFRDGKSLCMSWIFLGEMQNEQGMADKPGRSDCISCWKKRNKELHDMDVQKLRDAIDYVEKHHPLPRCRHGNHLRDHGQERLEPSCGCR